MFKPRFKYRINLMKQFKLALAIVAALFVSACDSSRNSSAAAHTEVRLAAALPDAQGLDIEDQELQSGDHRLGVNLPPAFSYSFTPMYVDLMRQARRFGTPQVPWDEKALLGEDGWPAGDFGIMIMSSQKALSTIGGIYTLRFRGQAKVALVASPGGLGTPEYDAASNITTIKLTLPQPTDQLALAFTSTRGPIKDVRLIRPDYDAKNPPLFTREFLAHIAPYKIVRLMDWLRTNNNPVSRWALRSTPETTHYASAKGAPWEDLIELAKVAKKDLWINIPGQADDEYVQTLAQWLRDALPPSTKLYIEYSNEVWNSMFSQTRENLEAAKREVETDPNSKLNLGEVNNPDIWKIRRVAQRSKQISDIFRTEFGDAAMMTRVRPVLAIQIVNTYSTELALDFMAKAFGPPNQYFYAIAGAPYFNLGSLQQSENLSVDQVLAAMSRSIDAMPIETKLEKNQSLAHWYQLPFIAYEGGADTFGPGSLDAKISASMDPRMEGLCRRYLDTWYGSGGGLFMWFTAGAGKWDTPYGTWELTPDLAITDTPKIRCLQSALKADPPVLRGRNLVPGRIDALAYAGNSTPYSDASRNFVRHLQPDGHIDYLVLAPHAGAYELSLHADAARDGNRVEISTAFGSLAGEIELPKTGWDQPADSPPLTIQLRKGFNNLRLTMVAKSSGFNLRHLNVRSAPTDGNEAVNSRETRP